MIRKSLLSNVNAIAEQLALLQRVDKYLTPDNIKVMKNVVNANLHLIVEDIRKGVTERGARKLDIHLQGNSTRAIDYVLYDAMVLTLTDGSKTTVTFEPTYDISKIHLAFMEYIKANPDTFIHTLAEVSTDTEYYTYPHLLRIIDTDILEFSNIEYVNMRVSSGQAYAVDVFPDFNWFKTTSSLLLLSQSLDFIIKAVEEIKRMYLEIIAKVEEAKEILREIERLHLLIIELYNKILLLVKRAEDAADKAEEEANRAKDEADRAKDEADRSQNEADRSKDEADRSEDAANRAENAILGAAKVFNITEDTTLRAEHRGCWLNCIVPNDLDVIRIAIPEKDETDKPWMDALEFIITTEGNGTAVVVAGDNVTLDLMDGCAPMIKRNGKVCSAKQIAAGQWRVYGALEDI